MNGVIYQKSPDTIQGKKKLKILLGIYPVIQPYFKKAPRYAVCSIVLNLLSQDGSRPNNSALAVA